MNKIVSKQYEYNHIHTILRLDQYNQSTRKHLLSLLPSTIHIKKICLFESNQTRNPKSSNVYIHNFPTLKIYDTKFSRNTIERTLSSIFSKLINFQFRKTNVRRESYRFLLQRSKYPPIRQLELHLHAGATFPGVLGRECASDRARSPPTLSASTSRRFPPCGKV